MEKSCQRQNKPESGDGNKTTTKKKRKCYSSPKRLFEEGCENHVNSKRWE
jgi:hypothetical protein